MDERGLDVRHHPELLHTIDGLVPDGVGAGLPSGVVESLDGLVELLSLPLDAPKVLGLPRVVLIEESYLGHDASIQAELDASHFEHVVSVGGLGLHGLFGLLDGPDEAVKGVGPGGELPPIFSI